MGGGSVFALVGRPQLGAEARHFEDDLRVAEPRHRGSTAYVNDAGHALLHQVHRARGERRGVGRRGDVILHHADRPFLRGQPQHGLDEVAAGRVQAARPEDSGGANDERRLQVGLRVEFSGQLRDRVGTERMGLIVFGVRPAGPPVEDVIGGVVNQLGIHLPAGQRDVAHRQSVHQVGRLRLLFGHIHLIVRRGVEDHLRIDLGQMLLDHCPLGDVQLSAVGAEDLVAALLQFRSQLHAELADIAENHRPLPHKSLRYHAAALRIPQPKGFDRASTKAGGNIRWM